MADMLMGSAQGAVDSLLGRLTSALVEETHLLGGVRGDVQFIKDEMESMNGFLMHVAEATGDDGEDHQVRAWMKQVADVAYSSQNCVDLYVQSLGPGAAAGNDGVLGFFRRLPRLVWTLPTRHRLATQLRELKNRAREVGERRQRYGVEAPANARRDGAKVNKKPWHSAGVAGDREEEDARRRALAAAHPSPDQTDHHIRVPKLLLDQGGDHAGSGLQHLKVVTILGAGGMGKTTTAQKVWNEPVVKSSFDVKTWICVSQMAETSMLLQQILTTLAVPEDQMNGRQEQQLVEKLQMHLEGKKVLVVLDDVWMGPSLLSCVKLRSALSDAKCCPGSALLVTARNPKVADSFSPCETFRMSADVYQFYQNNAIALLEINNPSVSDDLKHVLMVIVPKLAEIPLCLHMILRSLYLNPCRTKEDFQGLDHKSG